MSSGDEIDLIKVLNQLLKTLQKYKYLFLFSIFLITLALFFLTDRPYYNSQILIETQLPGNLTGDYINNINQYLQDDKDTILSEYSGLRLKTLKKIRGIEAESYANDPSNYIKLTIEVYENSILDSTVFLLKNALVNNPYFEEKLKEKKESQEILIKSIVKEIEYLESLKESENQFTREYDFEAFIELKQRKFNLEKLLNEDYIVKKNIDLQKPKLHNSLTSKIVVSFISGIIFSIIIVVLIKAIKNFTVILIKNEEELISSKGKKKKKK